MDIDARDRAAGEFLARNRRKRTALRARAFRRGGKALGRDLTVFHIQQHADQYDLAAEMTLEEILVVLRHAGVQVGERIGRDAVGATLKLQGKHIRRLLRRSRRDRFGQRPDAAGGKLRRHRWYFLLVDLEAQRQAADHAIGIGQDIARADVASESDGGALSRRRQQRAILMLNLAEHDLAGARAKRKRAQVVAVESVHPRAQGFVAERRCRLLDRSREYDA